MAKFLQREKQDIKGADIRSKRTMERVAILQEARSKGMIYIISKGNFFGKEYRNLSVNIRLKNI